jgi:hypothetical protein
LPVFKPLPVLLLLACAGCAPVPAGHWAGPSHNWRGLQASWDDATGWRDWLPSNKREPLRLDASSCVLMETQPRITYQDGINDAVNYQLCYNTPYALANGQRLDGR